MGATVYTTIEVTTNFESNVGIMRLLVSFTPLEKVLAMAQYLGFLSSERGQVPGSHAPSSLLAPYSSAKSLDIRIIW